MKGNDIEKEWEEKEKGRNLLRERERERKCDQWLKTIKEITIKDIQLKEERERERKKEREKERKKERKKEKVTNIF